jgi:hypothetical protein
MCQNEKLSILRESIKQSLKASDSSNKLEHINKYSDLIIFDQSQEKNPNETYNNIRKSIKAFRHPLLVLIQTSKQSIDHMGNPEIDHIIISDQPVHQPPSRHCIGCFHFQTDDSNNDARASSDDLTNVNRLLDQTFHRFFELSHQAEQPASTHWRVIMLLQCITADPTANTTRLWISSQSALQPCQQDLMASLETGRSCITSLEDAWMYSQMLQSKLHPLDRKRCLSSKKISAAMPSRARKIQKKLEQQLEQQRYKQSTRLAKKLIHQYPDIRLGEEAFWKVQASKTTAEQMSSSDISVDAQWKQEIHIALHRFPESVDLFQAAAKMSSMLSPRTETIQLATLYRQLNPFEAESYRTEIVNQLILGQPRRALAVIHEASRREVNLPATLISKAQRSQQRNRIRLFQLRRTTHQTRKLASKAFTKKMSAEDSWISEILGFSDYVLVANSTAFQLSEPDTDKLRAMKRPLFIYMNFGNPLFRQKRDLFYTERSHELLIGRPRSMMNQEKSLMFQPFDQQRFLGCLFFHHELGLQQEAARHNPSIRFSHPKKVKKAILRSYPHSIGQHDSGKKTLKRAPTIGWYALSLVDCLLHLQRHTSARAWSLGMSMSSTYIFEYAYKNDRHDYIFEQIALNHRHRTGQITPLGTTDQTAMEHSKRNQLLATGSEPFIWRPNSNRMQ